MRKILIILPLGVLLALAILYSALLGLRFMFLGRFTLPSATDFVPLAQKNAYIVQAVYDFKAEHGLWPERLENLVPRYLPKLPNDAMITLDDRMLSVHADLPHTAVCYSFRRDDEGWSSAGDFGTGKLPLPKMGATRPALTGDDLVRARLAEYDRRISAAPTGEPYYAYRNYTEKIEYLISLGRKADAIEACRAAAKAFPGWWRPPMTMVMIAGPDEVPKAEADLRAWTDGHPTFVHYWYLSYFYRQHGHDDMAVAALRQAVKYPGASDDPDPFWVPDAFLFNAAQYACQQRLPELVLEITGVWEKPRGVYSYHNDNLHAFKAAAELALGRFDEAKTDLNRVFEAGKTQGLWAQNLDQLQRAVNDKDQGFIYDAGKQQNEWTLFRASD